MSANENQHIRTELLYGKKSIEILSHKKVIIFGVGGVGGYAIEALARCGVGSITIVDDDTVRPSNINRQIIALNSTIGRRKVDVMAERIHDINPLAEVIAIGEFYDGTNVFLNGYDFIIDAIDTVSAKIALAVHANDLNIPIISSMGTGNRTDPSKLKLTDLAQTNGCPLARVMRHELRKRGIEHLQVLTSTEIPVKPTYNYDDCTKRPTIASAPFVPPVAGIMIASEVVRQLIGKNK